jgi:hypothetical protein
MRLLAQKLTQEQSNSIQNLKKRANHENRQICHRTENQPRRARYPPPKATFCLGISNLGVLTDSCQLFEGGATGFHIKGGTTGFHHEAARNFAGRDLHTSARGFGRSESGSHEPDHQSTQSKPVPTQCRRRANFRAALPVRASNRHNEACEISCWHKSEPLRKGTIQHNRMKFLANTRRVLLVAPVSLPIAFQLHAQQISPLVGPRPPKAGGETIVKSTVKGYLRIYTPETPVYDNEGFVGLDNDDYRIVPESGTGARTWFDRSPLALSPGTSWRQIRRESSRLDQAGANYRGVVK